MEITMLLKKNEIHFDYLITTYLDEKQEKKNKQKTNPFTNSYFNLSKMKLN